MPCNACFFPGRRAESPVISLAALLASQQVQDILFDQAAALNAQQVENKVVLMLPVCCIGSRLVEKKKYAHPVA